MATDDDTFVQFSIYLCTEWVYIVWCARSIKEQIVNRFVTDSGTITDGLNTTTDSLETSFVSEDKERKMYYVKDIPGVGACETNLQKLSSEVNTPDDTFNFKFNRI